MKKKILLFQANPQGTENLNLNSEIKTIKQVLDSASNRDNFHIEMQLATTYEDLQKYLLRENPHILHFCGHGNGNGEPGLYLLDKTEDPSLLQTEVLVNLVRILVEKNQNLECVLLNACYSYTIAKDLSKYVNYAIGMYGLIPDDVAIKFSYSLYTSLGEGCSIEDAYKLGINAIQYEHRHKLIDEYINKGEKIENLGDSHVACLFINPNSSLTNALCISSASQILPITSKEQLIKLIKKVDIKILISTAISVLQDAIDHHPEIHDYQEGEQSKLIKILLDTPPHQEQNLPRIIEFVRQLSLDDNIELSIRQKLESWLHTEANNLNIKLPSFSKLKPPNSSDKITQSYLMVTLENYSSKNNKFLMNAWLLPDETNPKELIPLDDNEDKKGVECTWDEAPSLLHQFVQQSQPYLKQPFKLIIELFLPYDYLGEQVYRWEIEDEFGDPLRISGEYIVIIRSSDRFKNLKLRNELSLGWQRWNSVFKTIERVEDIKKQFEHLDRISKNYNWKQLEIDLKKKLGMKIVGLPDSKTEQKELFKAFLKSGVPLAIWVGSESLSHLNFGEKIDQLLTDDSLRNLNNLLKSAEEKWQEAYAENYSEECLGSHLSILCDNLERMPPVGNQRLRPPGQ